MSTITERVTLRSFAFGERKLSVVSVSRATRTYTTRFIMYMRLDQLLILVVVVVFNHLLLTGLPGVFLVMLNMTMGLRGTTDHVFPIVVIVVLK
jgi:hypothetical protein